MVLLIDWIGGEFDTGLKKGNNLRMLAIEEAMKFSGSM